MAIWLIRLRHSHFLIRISDQQAGHATQRLPLGPNEWLIRFRPSQGVRRKWPALPEELVCRLIRYQVPGFRASWLITSLANPVRFTREELVDLYHRRWQIETIYREWKHGLDIQNLRSQTPMGIRKEVHAHLLLSNLVRWVMTEATEQTPDTPVDLSFLTALSHVKNAMLQLLRARPEELPTIHELLLTEVRQARIRKRPGRSYPRQGDHKPKYKGRGKYQAPARLPPLEALA